MADPLTNWVDGRIQVGVQTAMNTLLAHEDEILTNAAAKFRTAIIGDITAIPKVFTDALSAVPGEVSQLESQGLQGLMSGVQGLETIPQQTATQVASLISSLPAQVAQAIGNLFPHFLKHVATMPPAERETVLRAAQAVETPDDLAEHRKRVQDPEG